MLDKEIYLLLPYKVASGTSSDLTQAGLPSKCTSPPSFVGANPGATALLPDDLDVRFSTVSNLPPSRVQLSGSQFLFAITCLTDFRPSLKELKASLCPTPRKKEVGCSIGEAV